MSRGYDNKKYGKRNLSLLFSGTFLGIEVGANGEKVLILIIHTVGERERHNFIPKVQEWEGNETKTFPKFGNRSGTKESIPEIQEREGNEKTQSQNSGMGNGDYQSRIQEQNGNKFGLSGNKRLSFPGMARNGNYRSTLTHTPGERRKRAS